LNNPEKLTPVYIKDQKGKDILLAEGYETQRICCLEKKGKRCGCGFHISFLSQGCFMIFHNRTFIIKLLSEI